MKRTIYVPDALDRRLLAYVRTRPGATLSSVIQQAVETLISRNDSHQILRMAGLVRRASGPGAADRAEDHPIARER